MTLSEGATHTCLHIENSYKGISTTNRSTMIKNRTPKCSPKRAAIKALVQLTEAQDQEQGQEAANESYQVRVTN